MNLKDIAHLRLVNQRIVGSGFEKPSDVVRWMGALQAQDYLGALWGVGLRTKDATVADVERAIVNKEIVRTWPMRGTLHFVAPENIRWMLRLMTPRVIRGAASRHRNLGLDDAVFAKSRKVLSKALEGGKILTRGEMCEVLEHHGIATAGQRGIHIFWVLSQEGLLCFGPHKGKQPTFVLLDEWINKHNDLNHEDSLAKLAKMYFFSHGPATLRDFVWWTGLKVSDARVGIELIGSELRKEVVEDTVYWMTREVRDEEREGKEGPEGKEWNACLLPGFDEYMLGYRDRTAALDPLHSQKIVPGGNGMFLSTIVIDGQVRGTWKRAVKKNSVAISLFPFASLSKAEKEALEIAAERYGKFIGLPLLPRLWG